VCKAVSFRHTNPVPVVYPELRPGDIIFDGTIAMFVDFGSAMGGRCDSGKSRLPGTLHGLARGFKLGRSTELWIRWRVPDHPLQLSRGASCMR
jgi:hypothetical protein